MWFSEIGGFTACPILDRLRLRWGNVIPGPAVIEELDATTLVHPGYQGGGSVWQSSGAPMLTTERPARLLSKGTEELSSKSTSLGTTPPHAQLWHNRIVSQEVSLSSSSPD